MSIKLMSAIFETEFFDLKDEAGNTSKASTVKLVLLALADHANDEGEGAYPGLERMEKKTALSKQCLINAYDALKFNGVISLEGKSKFHTNNYTLNTQAFPRTFDETKAMLQVNPVDPQGKPGLPDKVNPVDPIHQLTTSKPSNGVPPLSALPLEWQIAGGIERVIMPDEFDNRARDAANEISDGTGLYALEIFELVYAFEVARQIVFLKEQFKGQRKVAKFLVDSKAKPEHVTAAVQKLMDAGMTVADLFSVSKTAVDLANLTPAQKGYNPQGLEVKF